LGKGSKKREKNACRDAMRTEKGDGRDGKRGGQLLLNTQKGTGIVGFQLRQNMEKGLEESGDRHLGIPKHLSP